MILLHGTLVHSTVTLLTPGPPIPVYRIPVSRYTEYRDTATNLGGINTGIEVTQYRYDRY